jgi:hypothetical protein
MYKKERKKERKKKKKSPCWTITNLYGTWPNPSEKTLWENENGRKEIAAGFMRPSSGHRTAEENKVKENAWDEQHVITVRLIPYARTTIRKIPFSVIHLSAVSSKTRPDECSIDGNKSRAFSVQLSGK